MTRTRKARWSTLKTNLTMTRNLLALLVCLVVTSVNAQLLSDDPDWKESEVPSPPAFDKSRLIPFEVSRGQSMSFGVDPATMTLNKDGVVRYVVVASAPSGSLNAFYEAIRCATGEVKTYARRTADSEWVLASDASWKSLHDNMPSYHSLRLARQGICDGRSPLRTVSDMVRKLRFPSPDNR